MFIGKACETKQLDMKKDILRCDVCNLVFDGAFSLNSHELQHHSRTSQAQEILPIRSVETRPLVMVSPFSEPRPFTSTTSVVSSSVASNKHHRLQKNIQPQPRLQGVMNESRFGYVDMPHLRHPPPLQLKVHPLLQGCLSRQTRP